jgi:ankyrin repeat protein
MRVRGQGWVHSIAHSAAAAARRMVTQGVEIIQALLELGADVTAHDKYERTPLHAAATAAAGNSYS